MYILMIMYLFCAKKLAENSQLCLDWVLKKKILIGASVESHFGRLSFEKKKFL